MPADPLPSTPTSTPYRFTIRVYWEDTDAGGVVFYANYLKFFERARTEWLRGLGHEQEALRAVERTMFVVTDTSVRYLRPARLDDRLSVSVELRRAGRVRLDLAQTAARVEADGCETPLAHGTIRIGCIDADTFRPRRVPTPLLRAIAPCLLSGSE